MIAIERVNEIEIISYGYARSRTALASWHGIA